MTTTDLETYYDTIIAVFRGVFYNYHGIDCCDHEKHCRKWLKNVVSGPKIVVFTTDLVKRLKGFSKTVVTAIGDKGALAYFDLMKPHQNVKLEANKQRNKIPRVRIVKFHSKGIWF